MKNSLNRFIAGIACTVLVAGLSVPAHAAEAQPEPYAISAAQWSREDFSQEANPDVFTATYDRALYNAIRQTLVDGTSDTAPAYTMVGDSDYSAVKNLLGRLEGAVRYEHYVPENFTNYWQYLDYFAVSAEMPENYQEAFDFIQPTIQATDGMTDREKVEYLNDYLCTLLAYKKGKTAGVTRTFAQHSGELERPAAPMQERSSSCAGRLASPASPSAPATTPGIWSMWTASGSMWTCP